jgi:hypothetical protein
LQADSGNSNSGITQEVVEAALARLRNRES